MYTITCPFCHKKLEVDSGDFDADACPHCGEEYYWTERCTEDFEDCWQEIEWLNL
jgi:predicted RNA-binding Zn-ribbon protein involved in translation (DUF1610 family)